jgi:hypothetical protein
MKLYQSLVIAAATLSLTACQPPIATPTQSVSTVTTPPLEKEQPNNNNSGGSTSDGNSSGGSTSGGSTSGGSASGGTSGGGGISGGTSGGGTGGGPSTNCDSYEFKVVFEPGDSYINLNSSKTLCSTAGGKKTIFLHSGPSCGYCNLLVNELISTNWVQNNPETKVVVMLSSSSLQRPDILSKYPNMTLVTHGSQGLFHYEFRDVYSTSPGSYGIPAAIVMDSNGDFADFGGGLCATADFFGQRQNHSICN